MVPSKDGCREAARRQAARGGPVESRGDRRGDGRPTGSNIQVRRARSRRRGLRRVGDSRPGRGDRGDRLEKDAGLRAPARAPGTRRGES